MSPKVQILLDHHVCKGGEERQEGGLFPERRRVEEAAVRDRGGGRRQRGRGEARDAGEDGQIDSA